VQRKEVEDYVETLIAKLLHATNDASLKVIIYRPCSFELRFVMQPYIYILKDGEVDQIRVNVSQSKFLDRTCPISQIKLDVSLF
jgi:hypothetical protein